MPGMFVWCAAATLYRHAVPWFEKCLNGLDTQRRFLSNFIPIRILFQIAPRDLS